MKLDNIKDGFIIKNDKSIYFIYLTDKIHIKFKDKIDYEYNFIQLILTVIKDIYSFKDIKILFKEYIVFNCFSSEYRYMDLMDYHKFINPKTDKSKKFLELINR